MPGSADPSYPSRLLGRKKSRPLAVSVTSASSAPAPKAREAMARAAVERDAEIRRLKAEGLVGVQIASRVGCSRSLVYELLNADRKAQYDARRREHWRHLRVA